MLPIAAPVVTPPDPLAHADALERESSDLCATINAANSCLLQLVAELDDKAPWGARGLASCAHWLNWRWGICMNSARERVRVAHAFKALANISAAFAAGELSYSKVRALTRIAEPANEAKLLELAIAGLLRCAQIVDSSLCELPCCQELLQRVTSSW